MSFLQQAKKLADMGFHVFPLAPGTKVPTDFMDDFPNRATRDHKKLEKWWLDPMLGIEQPYNIGISTSRFGDDEALVVIDVDNKNGKHGSEEIQKLELCPLTFTQHTPSGGIHLVYRAPKALRQGTNVLGKGLDIRSRGGYIAAVGSQTPIGNYTVQNNGGTLVAAPDWLVKFLGEPLEKEKTKASKKEINQDRAEKSAIEYLEKEAPLANQGDGGDHTTFLVACKLKDFGVDQGLCVDLLCGFWNDRCNPPWDVQDLTRKVEHAYRYGKEPVGVKSPEHDFGSDVSTSLGTHPFEQINKEYAFVVAGGGHHILWETKDAHGNKRLEHLSEITFHKKLAALTMITEKRKEQISELWMKSPKRRYYDGICFSPCKDAPKNWYNLWQGFAVTPSKNVSERGKRAVEAFIEHTRENVCGGDEKLSAWLIGFFAHLVQKPWEKPLVCLVFKGRKGVGKSALVDRVGHLLGNHYAVTANRRYLAGNFNGHLENCLLFALEEAFWSGDKQIEGVLKDLITGSHQLIEHKGKEAYRVENKTRFVILGNEDWIIPASEDERRYAVFEVGNGRKRDNDFFREMREGMEADGYAYLLHYLQNYDLKGLRYDEAPETEALHEQKVESLDPFYQFWHQCITEGRVIFSDFSEDWSEEIVKDSFREAFFRYLRDRRITARVPDDRKISKLLKRCLPSVNLEQKSKSKAEDGRKRVYRFPSLDQARKEWADFIGYSGEKWN